MIEGDGIPPVVHGPPGGMQVLFDDDMAGGLPLDPVFESAYGGPWALPAPTDRPYTMVNFVVSRDGRISYAEAGAMGGGAVANGCAADVWLMALLRARCDAVLVGDGTARAEPEHVWTVDHLGVVDAAAFAWLRARETRSRNPTIVVCSLTGAIERSWAVVERDDLDMVIATTSAGQRRAVATLGGRSNCEVVTFGVDRVDTAVLARWLRRERGVASLLCEGGPHLYGSMVADGAVDDEFLTMSPVLIGGTSTAGSRRPSLIEGVGFAPARSPLARPLSLRRSGDHLMLRSRLS